MVRAPRYPGGVSRSVIVSAVRTPFGKLGGSLAPKQATELGSIAIPAAPDPARVAKAEGEYVVMGQGLPGGARPAPAPAAPPGPPPAPAAAPAATSRSGGGASAGGGRANTLRAPAPLRVLAAGGWRSVSTGLMLSRGPLWAPRPGEGARTVLMFPDGLPSPFDNRHMVEQASFV